MPYLYPYLNKLLNNSSKRHLKRKRKQRKRHAERFFRSRIQKFNYYYTKFNSFFILKNKLISQKYQINNLDKKYKIGVKSVEMDYLKTKPLVSILKISKKYLRKNYIEKNIKYKISIFPNFWFTAKPKAVRMGKGKGEKKRKIFILKKGQIIYQIRIKKFKKKHIYNKELFLKIINFKIIFFLLKIRHKLPFKNVLTFRKF